MSGLNDAHEALIDRLNDAFVASNRQEFMDADRIDGIPFDQPILDAVTALVSAAWHQGYGAGSSDATDGWLRPGSPRTANPYTRVTAPEAGDDE